MHIRKYGEDMIPNISFGSTYKAYLTQSDCKKGTFAHQGLTDFCDNNDIYCREDFTPEKQQNRFAVPKPRYEEAVGERIFAEYTIVAPDKFDKTIETICGNQGIKFKKINKDDLTSIDSIKNRILPKEGYKLALIDSEKLDKLAKNQKDNNFVHCEKDYKNYYKKNADASILSSDKFSAETLYINYGSGSRGNSEELKAYADTWGIENLNKNSVSLWLSQEGDDRNRGVFFAMKDLGFKDIPVYLDKDSYKNAQILGLIKE